MTIDYLDCNATTPVDPRVQAEILHYFEVEFGNPASPHDYGRRAKKAVQTARDQIGAVVAARRHEVFFTSGATESNNLVLLGLADHGANAASGISSARKSSMPRSWNRWPNCGERGFPVTLVPPAPCGRVAAQAVIDALRPDTLLVSVMHVNNETGVVQPVAEIAEASGRLRHLLARGCRPGIRQGDRGAAPPADRPDQRQRAQDLRAQRDRGTDRAAAAHLDLPPLRPLQFGGGQELGLRPGLCRFP